MINELIVIEVEKQIKQLKQDLEDQINHINQQEEINQLRHEIERLNDKINQINIQNLNEQIQNVRENIITAKQTIEDQINQQRQEEIIQANSFQNEIIDIKKKYQKCK